MEEGSGVCDWDSVSEDGELVDSSASELLSLGALALEVPGTRPPPSSAGL